MSADEVKRLLEEQEMPKPAKGFRIHKAPDYKSLYANNTGFATNAFDFAVVFGEILGVEDEQLIVEQKVRIVMSPLHAKIFSAALAANVANFEKQFGEIKIPVGAAVGE